MNGREEVDPNKLNEHGCEYGRSLKQDLKNFKDSIGGDVEDMEQDLSEIVENLQGRPSWTVSVLITLMTSAIVGMAVLILGG